MSARAGGDVVGRDADAIRAEVGGNVAGGVIGNKNVTVNHYEQPQPVPQPLPPSHPFQQLSLADVFSAMLDNPLTGEPGLVTRIVRMEAELAEMRRNQNPRWFQFLAVVMALVLIILLLFLLMRMR